jgi:hypothetical protein
MLSRLLQVNALAGAVEGDFALLATALRTDSAVNRWTEALFFAFAADCTRQIWGSPVFIMAWGAGKDLSLVI